VRYLPVDAMTGHRNHLGQPIGPPVAGWTPPPRPPRTPLAGRFCQVEPLAELRAPGR
jgi:hypothetical protein